MHDDVNHFTLATYGVRDEGATFRASHRCLARQPAMPGKIRDRAVYITRYISPPTIFSLHRKVNKEVLAFLLFVLRVTVWTMVTLSIQYR
jgi:hypothetical protein